MQINNLFFESSINFLSIVNETNDSNNFFCHLGFKSQLLLLVSLLNFDIIFS